ncbi:MAG: FABP family protein [Bifidobacteriaceae bacterium]|jgi:hypothetical protein|nr:FABP family protein [Bifidobacteriaceae bacterium]
MTSQLPTDLPPEVYPLAWLVGAWRGSGTIGYGPVAPAQITQEVRFRATAGPYLAYTARTWLAPAPADQTAPTEAAGRGDGHGIGHGDLWHEEAGFWRVTPGQAQADPPFEVEFLVSDAAGYQSLYLGEVAGPRLRLATDAVIRTASAPEVNAATRMYGLVEGDLLWAWDIAGFGRELGSYMAARLAPAPA